MTQPTPAASRWIRVMAMLLTTLVVTLLGLGRHDWAAAGQAQQTIPPLCPTYESVDVPKPVPDGNASGVNSTLTVPGLNLVITHLAVRLNSIQHTYVGDIRLTLFTPDGQAIKLLDRSIAVPNYDGDNFYGTTLDDRFATWIVDGSPPFTGGYRPTDPLSVMEGRNGEGVWRLNVADVAVGDSGSLGSWGVEICGFTAVTRIRLPVIRR